MRMRRKQNLDNRVLLCDKVLIGMLLDYDKTCHKNNITEILDFHKIFGNNNPVMLEIGCGKGGFINQAAKQNPDINYIALEKSANVIITAMERTIAEKITNVKYIIGLAEYLDRILQNNSISGIYLNFSCPYPKTTYANRRLTHERFLKIYDKILKKGAAIKQKTDNRNFFEYSKKSFLLNDYVIKILFDDLHNSDFKGNIITEYECIFSEKGFPIHYLEAYKH